jgi:hypothetical protein
MEWTEVVDRALELLGDMSGGEAATRYGFGNQTITDWRRRRRGGEVILTVQRKNRHALARLFDGHDSVTIPVGLSARRRRCIPLSPAASGTP